jgi:hypothetical protein
MSMSIKGAFAILFGMVIILAVNPRFIYSIYDNILGRIVLIGIVLFLTMNNTTLGLLATLVIIISLNQFSTFVEGMENATTDTSQTTGTSQTIGDDNVPNTGNIKVLTKSAISSLSNGQSNGQTISALKEKAASAGIDKEDIKNAIASKSEKEFPIPTSGSTENTMPATEGMLSRNVALHEAFSTLS